MVPDEVNVYLYKEGFHLLFPMRGQDHWRIVGILPPALRGREDVRFEDVIPSLREEAGAGLAFKECSWFSTYRIHHRSASRFRERRAFVLGDAAHIHSPVGAQGMNTGLQDAYNLGWKLALVAQGRADAALLDSYEAERLPVARRLLDTTDRGFKLVVSDSWWAGLLRTEVLARVGALAMGRPRIQQTAFRVISQIGIHYRASAAVGVAGRPAPGRAARGRSLSVDAAALLGGRAAGGPVRQARRPAFPSARVRAAGAAASPCCFPPSWCASTPCLRTPTTLPNWHARSCRCLRSTCCGPTGMWRCAARSSTSRPLRAMRPVEACERRELAIRWRRRSPRAAALAWLHTAVEVDGVGKLDQCTPGQ